MRVLVFRHIPFEHMGLIQPVLESRGIGFDYADLYQPGASLPDRTAYDGLVFMGGPMSVNDPLPYIDAECAAIAEAVACGQPVLGICLGSQLIAKALGAKVYRNAVKEIGWFDISLTPEGQRDPLFQGTGPVESVFHWHGETFELPQRAVWLASSAACRHQAFRVGASTYGLQFHLEVTPEMIADWCTQDANSSDVRELDGPVDPHHNAQRLERISHQVFGRWCDLLASAQSAANFR